MWKEAGWIRKEAGRMWKEAGWMRKEAGRRWKEAGRMWKEAVWMWKEAGRMWNNAAKMWTYVALYPVGNGVDDIGSDADAIECELNAGGNSVDAYRSKLDEDGN